MCPRSCGVTATIPRVCSSESMDAWQDKEFLQIQKMYVEVYRVVCQSLFGLEGVSFALCVIFARPNKPYGALW